MSNAATLPLPSGLVPALRTARAVIESVGPGRRVRVRQDEDSRAVQATLAAFGYDEPRVGDEVLLLFDGEEAYVIGVLRALREVMEKSDAGEEPAAVGEDRGLGGMKVRRDESGGETELVVPRGDLRLCVEGGRLELSARDGVTVRSDRSVALRSGGSLELGVGEGEAGSSGLRLTPREVAVTAAELLLAAGRARIAASELGLTARSFEVTARTVRHVAQVVETRAHRVVERSRDSYRKVERLAQLETGRLRTIARKGVRLLGERVNLAAKSKMKIQGEKIYLA